MKIFISLLVLVSSSLCLCGETAKDVSLDIYDFKDYQDLESSQGWLKGVQSFRLDRNASDKAYLLTYLVATDEENATFIFDTLSDAFACKFEVFDIDGDGNTELLVNYSTGAYAHILEIYTINAGKRAYEHTDIKKWDSALCSLKFGRKGIIVEKGKITTLSYNYGDNPTVDVDIYKVEKEKLTKLDSFVKDFETVISEYNIKFD